MTPAAYKVKGFALNGDYSDDACHALASKIERAVIERAVERANEMRSHLKDSQTRTPDDRRADAYNEAAKRLWLLANEIQGWKAH